MAALLAVVRSTSQEKDWRASSSLKHEMQSEMGRLDLDQWHPRMKYDDNNVIRGMTHEIQTG